MIPIPYNGTIHRRSRDGTSFVEILDVAMEDREAFADVRGMMSVQPGVAAARSTAPCSVLP